jgi:translocation and assembly module TamA
MRAQTSCWARACLVGVVVLAADPGTSRAQAPGDPREAPEVRALRIVGASAIEKRELEYSIATRATQCKNVLFTPICKISRAPLWVEKHYLDRKELDRDSVRLRVYYWKRGFREAMVRTNVVKTGERTVEVTLTVEENRPTLVRRLIVDYDSTLLTAKRIEKGAVLRAGMPFDVDRLDSTRANYLNELFSRGHSDGVVDTAITVDDSVAYTADVRIRLVPNHRTTVGTITIKGLNKVDEQTVLNSLSLRPNEPFRRGDMLESTRNLYESNLFRLINITVPDTSAPAKRDSVKAITVLLSEAALHEERYGLGITNIDFVQGQAHWAAFNLFGGARRLDIDLAVGNVLARQLAGHGFFHDPSSIVGGADSSGYMQPTWSVSAQFRQPAFMRRPKDQFGVSAFAHRRATPGIFIDRGYGSALTLTRQLAARAPASATYRFEINRVQASDVYFCVNYGVCDVPTIESLRAHRSLSPLSLGGFIERSDNPLDPTRGYSARMDFEHASSLTGSDYRYNRAFLDVGAYDHRGLNIFAAHLRLGFVKALSGNALTADQGLGVLHPRKRFYAGGASSVRGYGENMLGPRLLTIDPLKLAGPADDGGAGCSVTSDAIQDCDPNMGSIANRDFLPQALGGTSVIEGSVEWRFPSRIHPRLDAAVFVDAAVVGQSALKSLLDVQAVTEGSAAITPGFGLRYRSPVGPIRFDVGFNPRLTEDLGVVTEIFENGQRKIVALSTPRRWSSTGPTLLDRLTLHFSIGQAY